MWSVDRLLIWGREAEAKIYGDFKDRPISGFSINTQTLRKGEIFIALKGTKQDGHLYVEEAFRKGAAGAMVARSWFSGPRTQGQQNLFHSDFMLVVEDTLFGLQSLAKWHRQFFNCPLIGITGSNGKTTTKEMLATILGRRGSVLKTEGNLNNHIGLPLSLLRLTKDDQAAVLELGSSRPGDMRLLCDIAKPTMGMITNIGHAHLEFLINIEGVAAEKGVLFETIAPNGIAIINKDDPYLSPWEKAASKKWTYSLGGDADLTASKIEQRDNGIAFTLTLNRNQKGGGGEMKVVLPLFGEHQVYNALAASTAALALGYEFDEIRSALRETHPIPLRGEVITWHGATILLDAYNANPASMKVGIQTLSAFSGLKIAATPIATNPSPALLGEGTRRRKVALLGDMLELGESANSAHREIGRKVAQNRIDRLITVGRFSEVTAHSAVEEGMEKGSVSSYKDIASIDLANEICEGDVVLIKGSRGMRMENLLSCLHEGKACGGIPPYGKETSH